MSQLEWLGMAALFGLILLWFTWILEYGFGRGSLAWLCRILWILPLALAFFPDTRTEQLPRTMALKPLHIMLDDSQSMKTGLIENGATMAQTADEVIQGLQDECLRLGCMPKVSRLSELEPDTAKGMTPLSNALDSWFFSTNGEPWVVISDGGDYRPTEAWDPKLTGIARNANGPVKGAVVGFVPKGFHNIWLETSDTPIFSFEDRPIEVVLSLKRDKAEDAAETVQVQVLGQDKTLATSNATFEKGEAAVELSLVLPPLARGQHLLTIKALPTGQETSLWDNTIHKTIEVLPNTVGVLHLLGAPSWDGRFLRRYLKSEPKYDLISFFILRDPGDVQMVNERELSLIPFPVDRLFNEELSNFHSVIVQNFALYQFLEPAYQKNLVNFVKEGGSLLFIGGPRALKAGDFRLSPLASILPFTVTGNGKSKNVMNGSRDSVDEGGPSYDAQAEFSVELASPDPNQRSLANVYDDWENMEESLKEQKGMKGIHRMDNVEFKQGETTPLLNARLKDGSTIPLAVASYPGKGRAIWVFSDSFWRYAMAPAANSSRSSYSEFYNRAMTWLLREELKKPLILKGLRLNPDPQGIARWQMVMAGPAAKYFRLDGSWKVNVCGVAVDAEKINLEKLGSDSLTLGGTMAMKIIPGARCQASVDGQHPAFGSLKASLTTVIPETYKDEDIMASPYKLERLAKLTGAGLSYLNSSSIEPLAEFLNGVSGTQGVSIPSRYKTIRDFYWVMDRWWFWLLVLGLPLEVLVRRWPYLMTGRPRGRRSANHHPSEITGK